MHSDTSASSLAVKALFGHCLLHHHAPVADLDSSINILDQDLASLAHTHLSLACNLQRMCIGTVCHGMQACSV